MKTKSKRSPESRRSREKRLRYHKAYSKAVSLRIAEEDYQQLVELHKKTIRRM